MICCKDCQWFFKDGEFSIEQANFSDGNMPELMSIVSDGGAPGPIRMCQHSKCFMYEQKSNPVKGATKEKIRVSGQGILNRDNDCKRFEPSRWYSFKKFWKIAS